MSCFTHSCLFTVAFGIPNEEEAGSQIEQTVKTDTQTTPSVPVRISDYVSLPPNEHQLNYNSEHSWCLCVHSLPKVSFLRKGKRVKVLLQSSPQMVDHPLSILIYFLLLFGSCCDFLQLHPKEKENVREQEEKSKWGRESSKGERMRERKERKITVSQMRFPRMSLLIRVSVLGNKQ